MLSLNYSDINSNICLTRNSGLFLYEIHVLDLLGERITIVFDATNIEKLRNIQAKMIKNSTKSVSFSHVVNLLVSEGLKKFKI